MPFYFGEGGDPHSKFEFCIFLCVCVLLYIYIYIYVCMFVFYNFSKNSNWRPSWTSLHGDSNAPLVESTGLGQQNVSPVAVTVIKFILWQSSPSAQHKAEHSSIDSASLQASGCGNASAPSTHALVVALNEQSSTSNSSPSTTANSSPSSPASSALFFYSNIYN